MSGKRENIIGDTTRTFRRRLKITQKELAARAETTEAAISHIETGIRKPSSAMIARLARALGCSVDDLLKGVAKASEETVFVDRVVGAMRELPPGAQEQVADFCDFLRTRIKQRKK